MNWLETEVSIYNYHGDNTGQPMTFREILFTQVGIPHNVWVPHLEKEVRGTDIDTIIKLRELDRNAPDYDKKKTELKALLHAYTPAALLATKKKNNVQVISRTIIMQIDFDYAAIRQYDLEDLKRAVFALPFIAFCGLSCSGDGFYALAAIAEPDRLAEYAEHIFEVLKQFGVPPDESKGKKVENLRYLSYDSKMLIREDPEPLKVTRFKRKEAPKISTQDLTGQIPRRPENLVTKQLELLKNAAQGNRFNAVREVSFTLGGLGDASVLDLIIQEISANQVFNQGRQGFVKTATDCFRDGKLKPLTK
jgi:hypothetical protein